MIENNKVSGADLSGEYGKFKNVTMDISKKLKQKDNKILKYTKKIK